MEFKAGDKVKCYFFGDEVFILDSNRGSDYPLGFDSHGERWTFTDDGRFHDDHSVPVLTLVERSTKKVKKTYSGWLNIYPSGGHGYHKERDKADFFADDDRIACIQIKGEYEVEE